MNKVIGFRKMLGFTQKDMAYKLGISINTYANKERGNTEFTRSEMEKFHRILTDNIGYISIELIFF